MKSKSKTRLQRTFSSNKRIDALYKNISKYIQKARCNIIRTVDTEMVRAYWLIGRDVVEEEQKGVERAKYGTFLLEEISKRLANEFGKGFSVDTLERARKFYLTYSEVVSQKSAALRRKLQPPNFNPNLGWIHYRALIREDREKVRKFYELEAIKNCWSGRELERQMGSLLFERLLKSRDKKGLMKLAKRGQEIVTPEDAIKEPVVLEFLNLPESCALVESKLEEALINNMQGFLLELGQGFAFVGRQKRITLDGDHFYIDLVFYNTILHAYLIVEIVTTPLTHADLGQLQLYVNYFDMEVKNEGDNPTIGLILCTHKNKKMVQYFLGNKVKNIFASKYQFYLPTEKQLEDELKREIKDMKYKLEYKRNLGVP